MIRLSSTADSLMSLLGLHIHHRASTSSSSSQSTSRRNSNSSNSNSNSNSSNNNNNENNNSKTNSEYYEISMTNNNNNNSNRNNNSDKDIDNNNKGLVLDNDDDRCCVVLESIMSLLYDSSSSVTNNNKNSNKNDDHLVVESGDNNNSNNATIGTTTTEQEQAQQLSNVTTTTTTTTAERKNVGAELVGNSSINNNDNNNNDHEMNNSTTTNNNIASVFASMFPTFWELFLTLYIPVLIQSVFGTYYIARSILIGYSIPYGCHLIYVMIAKLLIASSSSSNSRNNSTISKQHGIEHQQHNNNDSASYTGLPPSNNINSNNNSNNHYSYESSTAMNDDNNNNINDNIILTKASSFASSCSYYFTTDHNNTKAATSFDHHHHTNKDQNTPPTLIKFLAIFTIAALIVHPDGHTWILLRKIRDVIMSTLRSSTTLWAIIVNDYGTIVSTTLALSTFLALFFLVYILHQTLKCRTKLANNNNCANHSTIKSDKSKRKKNKKHHHNHHHHHHGASHRTNNSNNNRSRTATNSSTNEDVGSCNKNDDNNNNEFLELEGQHEQLQVPKVSNGMENIEACDEMITTDASQPPAPSLDQKDKNKTHENHQNVDILLRKSSSSNQSLSNSEPAVCQTSATPAEVTTISAGTATSITKPPKFLSSQQQQQQHNRRTNNLLRTASASTLDSALTNDDSFDESYGGRSVPATHLSIAQSSSATGSPPTKKTKSHTSKLFKQKTNVTATNNVQHHHNRSNSGGGKGYGTEKKSNTNSNTKNWKELNNSSGRHDRSGGSNNIQRSNQGPRRGSSQKMGCQANLHSLSVNDGTSSTVSPTGSTVHHSHHLHPDGSKSNSVSTSNSKAVRASSIYSPSSPISSPSRWDALKPSLMNHNSRHHQQPQPTDDRHGVDSSNSHCHHPTTPPSGGSTRNSTRSGNRHKSKFIGDNRLLTSKVTSSSSATVPSLSPTTLRSSTNDEPNMNPWYRPDSEASLWNRDNQIFPSPLAGVQASFLDSGAASSRASANDLNEIVGDYLLPPALSKGFGHHCEESSLFTLKSEDSPSTLRALTAPRGVSKYPHVYSYQGYDISNAAPVSPVPMNNLSSTPVSPVRDDFIIPGYEIPFFSSAKGDVESNNYQSNDAFSFLLNSPRADVSSVGINPFLSAGTQSPRIVRPPPGLSTTDDVSVDSFGFNVANGGAVATMSTACDDSSSKTKDHDSNGFLTNSYFESLSIPNYPSYLPPVHGVTTQRHEDLEYHVAKENPFASISNDDNYRRDIANDDEEKVFEAELQELGGQIVGSILDY